MNPAAPTRQCAFALLSATAFLLFAMSASGEDATVTVLPSSASLHAYYDRAVSANRMLHPGAQYARKVRTAKADGYEYCLVVYSVFRGAKEVLAKGMAHGPSGSVEILVAGASSPEEAEKAFMEVARKSGRGAIAEQKE